MCIRNETPMLVGIISKASGNCSSPISEIAVITATAPHLKWIINSIKDNIVRKNYAHHEQLCNSPFIQALLYFVISNVH